MNGPSMDEESHAVAEYNAIFEKDLQGFLLLFLPTVLKSGFFTIRIVVVLVLVLVVEFYSYRLTRLDSYL